MYCNNCGNELIAGAKFCNNCGAPVNQEADDGISQGPKQEVTETEITSNEETKEVSEKTENTGQNPVKEKRPFNKKLAVILSLVLVLLIAGLGTGFYIVKAKTDDFRNYIAETEKKAKRCLYD